MSAPGNHDDIISFLEDLKEHSVEGMSLENEAPETNAGSSLNASGGATMRKRYMSTRIEELKQEVADGEKSLQKIVAQAEGYLGQLDNDPGMPKTRFLSFMNRLDDLVLSLDDINLTLATLANGSPDSLQSMDHSCPSYQHTTKEETSKCPPPTNEKVYQQSYDAPNMDMSCPPYQPYEEGTNWSANNLSNQKVPQMQYTPYMDANCPPYQSKQDLTQSHSPPNQDFSNTSIHNKPGLNASCPPYEPKDLVSPPPEFNKEDESFAMNVPKLDANCPPYQPKPDFSMNSAFKPPNETFNLTKLNASCPPYQPKQDFSRNSAFKSPNEPHAVLKVPNLDVRCPPYQPELVPQIPAHKTLHQSTHIASKLDSIGLPYNSKQDTSQYSATFAPYPSANIVSEININCPPYQQKVFSPYYIAPNMGTICQPYVPPGPTIIPPFNELPHSYSQGYPNSTLYLGANATHVKRAITKCPALNMQKQGVSQICSNTKSNVPNADSKCQIKLPNQDSTKITYKAMNVPKLDANCPLKPDMSAQGPRCSTPIECPASAVRSTSCPPNMPDNEVSNHGMPDNVMPERYTLDNRMLERAIPENGEVKCGMLDNGVSEHGMPDDGVPQSEIADSLAKGLDITPAPTASVNSAADGKEVSKVPASPEARKLDQHSSLKSLVPLDSATNDETRVDQFPLPQQDLLEMDQSYIGLITHVENPGSFYIMTGTSELDITDQFESFLREMTQYYAKNFVALGRRMFTDLVAACIMDTWQRCLIVSCEDLEDMEVFLVDLGRMDRVSYKHVQPLPKHLCTKPPFARHCHLFGMDNRTEKWSEEVITQMRSLVGQFVDVVVEENTSECLAVCVGIAKGENLLDLLHAIQLKTLKVRSGSSINIGTRDSESAQQRTAMVKAASESGNSSNYDCPEFDDVLEAVQGYHNRDEKDICPHYKGPPETTCFKGRRCRKRHVLIRPDGITLDRQEISFRTATQLTLPSAGASLRVQVTHVANGDVFFAYIYDDTTTDPSKLKNAALQELIEQMNSLSARSDLRPLSVRPAEHEVVVAEYQHDNKYYRAQVQAYNPDDDTFMVRYVDYGSCFWVSAGKLKQMSPCWLQLPFQAVQCTLAGVDFASDEHRLAGKDILAKCIMGKTFDAIVITSHLDSLKLTLMDELGFSVSEMLVLQHHSVFKQAPVEPPRRADSLVIMPG